MRLIGLAIATFFLAACSSAPPPLLAPGVACQENAPCASASTDRCAEVGDCNHCSCRDGHLSCTIIACDAAGYDAGH